MFEMDLNRLEKFNFFKKNKEAKPDIKSILTYFSKRLLKLSGFFVIAPTLLYLLLNSAPELKYNLPVLLDSISSQSLKVIALTIYGAYMAASMLRETFNTSLEKQDPNIFVPVFFALEIGLILEVLPSVWAIIWPLIR